MRTFKAVLSYDGTAYCGWQVQPNGVTVQAQVERALAGVTQQRIRVTASGRTDAGVHALGQVASFDLETSLDTAQLQRALNANLPPDIRVLAVEVAPPNFCALRSAVAKCYRYVIQDGKHPDVFRRHYCWFVRGRLDEGAMHAAAQALRGEHDFASFQAAGSPRASTVRTVRRIEVIRAGDTVQIEIEANGFLYNMVRNIVGTLVEVGLGEKGVNWPAEVLAARERCQAGLTAPPQGLFLVRVEYAPQ
jgi:tRNA pseudouridine38-40 synthase